MPSSLRRFRELTMGRPMIMGRKTFEAIGRALDGRDTIVVTRSQSFEAEGVYRVSSIAEAFARAMQLADERGVGEIIVAGGGEVYAATLAYATRVHVDLIDCEPTGDTVFPVLDPSAWRETRRTVIPPHVRDQYPSLAVEYERIGAPEPLLSP
jgi:dihydrofolate reductase